MQDFNTWIKETGKESDLKAIIESGAGIRQKVRGNELPSKFRDMQYPDAYYMARTPDAAVYLQKT